MQEPGVVIRVPLGLSRRSATGLVAVLFSVSLVFVAGTAVFIRYPRAAGGEWADAGWPKLILIQLHLGAENEAAAWFASMVLPGRRRRRDVLPGRPCGATAVGLRPGGGRPRSP